jgi:hypothetical protein
MAEGSDHVGGKGTIPFFFYDVISHIIPGTVLLIGGLSIWRAERFPPSLPAWLNNLATTEESIAAVSVICGVAFLLFLGFAATVGFLLAAVSHQAVEKIWRRWTKYSLDGLARFMGDTIPNKALVGAYKDCFGIDLNQDSELEGASNLCVYYTWKKDATLGAMMARFDGEKLMSQSLILVGMILFVEAVGGGCCDRSRYPYMSVCGLTLLVAAILLFGVASGFAFDYHRKKRVYSRFQIFLALSSNSSRTNSDPG